MNTVGMTSNRPYLLRAMYDWISDNGLTPYILVDAAAPGVEVPQSAVKDGRVVLNVAARAVAQLELGMDKVRFMARFSGISRNVEAAWDDRRTIGEKAADIVADFGGSWNFIGLFFAILVVWMAFNVWAATRSVFDPYPFILLNLVLSCLAAIQAPIIMMAQNRQAERDRIDAAHDYEVNLKAEIEIMALHEKVDEMRRAQPDAATGSAPDMRRDLAMIAERLGRIEERLLTARWTSGH